MVCTCAAVLEPGAAAIPNAITKTEFVIFINVLTLKPVAIERKGLPALPATPPGYGELLHSIGIDADTEWRRVDRIGNSSEGMLIDRQFRRLSDRDDCVDLGRGHLPEGAFAR